MPCHIQPTADFLHLRLIGPVTRDEFRQFLQELQTIESNGRVPNRLIDLREAVFSELKSWDIQAVAKQRRETHFPNPFRSALFAPNPGQLGYARMFQTLNNHPDITLEVFTNEAEALAWLRGDSAPRSLPPAPTPGS